MAVNFENVARPYAVAAFGLAKENDTLKLWSTVLSELAVVIAHREVKALIANPALTQEKLLQFMSTFISIAETNGAAPTRERMVNFLKLLIENKRLLALPAISAHFERMFAESSGFVQLKVTSAFPLKEKESAHIIDTMKKQLNSKVRCEFDTDEDLLGGFLVRSENWVLDSTIRGKLKRLKISMRA